MREKRETLVKNKVQKLLLEIIFYLVYVDYNEPMRCTTVSVKTSKNLHTLHVELYQSLVLFVYIPISSLYLPGSRSWLDAKLHCARTSPACH